MDEWKWMTLCDGSSRHQGRVWTRGEKDGKNGWMGEMHAGSLDGQEHDEGLRRVVFPGPGVKKGNWMVKRDAGNRGYCV